MAIEELDSLLERMPKIAEAVNAFVSPEVQGQAFDALLRAAGVLPTPASSQQMPPAQEERDQKSANATESTDNSKRTQKARNSAGSRDRVEAIRNLDFRPEGKQSFTDFVSEKKPSSNQDKFAVAIYWLEQIAAVKPITMGHVAAVFKQTPGWRESGNIRVGLTSTASRKNTIDTSELNDLKTTPHGRNFVNHDLPPKTKVVK